jgi:hypothetical protein
MFWRWGNYGNRTISIEFEVSDEGKGSLTLSIVDDGRRCVDWASGYNISNEVKQNDLPRLLVIHVL